MTPHDEPVSGYGTARAEQARAASSVHREPHGGDQGGGRGQTPNPQAGGSPGLADPGRGYPHPAEGASPQGPAQAGYYGGEAAPAPPGFVGAATSYGHGGAGMGGWGGAQAPGPGRNGHGGVGGYSAQPVYGGYAPYPQYPPYPHYPHHPPYPPYVPQGAPWAVVPPGMGQGISELVDDALKGGVNPSKLGRYLNDGEFIKGALVGAAVVLLLTDNPLRQALFRGTAKAAEKVKEGFGQAQQAVAGKAPAAKTPGEEPQGQAD